MPTWLLNHGGGDTVPHTPGDGSKYWTHYKKEGGALHETIKAISEGDLVVMRPLKFKGKKGKRDCLMHGKIIHKDMEPGDVPGVKDYCINNVTSWTSLSREEQNRQIQHHLHGHALFVIIWFPYTTPYHGEDKYKLSPGQVIREIN